MNKITKFIKTHKKLTGVIAATTGVIVGAAVAAITRDKSSNYVDIEFPELNTGECTALYRGIKGKYTGCVTGSAIAVDITDLGKFGDALATVEGIDRYEPIRLIFATERSFN